MKSDAVRLKLVKLSLLITMCKENFYVKTEKLETQICCTRQGLNPWSPGGSFMVREMAITSPYPHILRVKVIPWIGKPSLDAWSPNLDKKGCKIFLGRNAKLTTQH